MKLIIALCLVSVPAYAERATVSATVVAMEHYAGMTVAQLGHNDIVIIDNGE